MESQTIITVYFEPPFWIVLFEAKEAENCRIAKEILGTSEPSGAELMDFFNKIDFETLRFSAPLNDEPIFRKKLRFKKQLHKNKDLLESPTKNTFTKAQALLKLQQGLTKMKHKKFSRQEKETMLQRKFELRQLKKKEKMKGH